MAGNKVYVQGNYVDVHDNEVVNLNIDKVGTLQMGEEQQKDEAPLPTETIEEELCHFIHPELDEEGQKKAHKEIKNLVAHYQLKDIIKYLKGMAKEKRILLPQSADNAYRELVRMGMPADEKGFSLKTFYREYPSSGALK